MRLRESFKSLLLGGLLFAAPAIAATSLNFHLDDRLSKLLDANAPATERQAAFDAYKKDALAGDIAAQYFVGNLYRLGDRLPGNVLGHDADQAFRYLSTAGGHGFVIAMAKTAEPNLS
jgi:TPR repeat protein